MSTIIRGSVRKPLFSLFIWRGGFVLLVYALQLMTMRFAALERKRAAGFARISIESVDGFKFNALLWHFGFASLKDKGLWTIGYHAYTGTIRYWGFGLYSIKVMVIMLLCDQRFGRSTDGRQLWPILACFGIHPIPSAAFSCPRLPHCIHSYVSLQPVPDTKSSRI